jgi:integrase
MLMSSALKPSTKKTYSCAQQKFIEFCKKYEFIPMPVTESTLLLYVAYLFDQGFKGSSIRVYISAIRSMHVYSGFDYPTNMVRLQLSIKGAVTESAPPVRKLPITYSVLSKMLATLRGRFDAKMLYAVMTLAFFGCFRASELCVMDGKVFDESSNLSYHDLVMNIKERNLCIFLKKSKSDVNSQGTSIYIGYSGTKTCAYCRMLDYLLYRPTIHPKTENSPLFVNFHGEPLRKDYFVSTTRMALSLAGFNPSKFSGHSYRAGAATTAGDRGFEEWELKMMGRWKSSAYNLYLRNPKVVASFAERLVSP